jgi:hypothetical protein
MTTPIATTREDRKHTLAGIPSRFYRGLGLRAQGDIAGMTVYRTKKGKQVIFPKTRPKAPPGPLALRNQNRFRLAAAAWMAIGPNARLRWKYAARQAALGVTGYNLFIAWQMKRDRAAMKTIERLSGQVLIDDSYCEL